MCFSGCFYEKLLPALISLIPFQLGGLSDLIGAQKPNEGKLAPNGAATSVGGGALTPIDSMADHDSHWYPRSPSHYG